MLSPGTESVVLPLQSREEMGFSEQNLAFLLAKGEMDVGQVKTVGMNPFTSTVSLGK